MNEKEKRIKQQRTIEATAKNLLGSNGKLITIAKFMGQPIVSHESGGFATEAFGYTEGQTYDFWNLDSDDADELPTIQDMSEEWLDEPLTEEWTTKKRDRKNVHIETLGWHFDGLNRGMHLEIKYVHRGEDEKSEVNVHYKGHLVFKELSGELLVYVPDEWEDHVESLFRIARKKDDESRKKEKEARKEEAQKAKSGWLDKMKEYWGFNI